MVIVQGLKDSKANSARSTEWKLQDGLLYYCEQIYVLDDAELRWKIME